MYVLKYIKKRLLVRQQLQGVIVHQETGSKRGGGEPAPCTITRSCVFLDHNLKLSPNRALLKWCFRKVATLRWRLLLRPLLYGSDHFHVFGHWSDLSMNRFLDKIISLRRHVVFHFKVS
jgi:hypothetical protein